MKLQSLTLRNFRSYSEREFDFSNTVTLLAGPNGAGKTNVLEAIYTVFQGKSFRDGDDQLVRHGEAWWAVRAIVDASERELRYQPGQTVAKQLIVDGGKKVRFTYKQQLPVVLFEPNHLSLFHGSPGGRRQYIDTILLQIDPTYRRLLAHYERALLQRNNLLKRGGSLERLADAVFVWDISLSECGATIIQKRQELVDRINTTLTEVYRSISGDTATAVIYYETHGKTGAHGLASLLAARLESDMYRGYTSVGPHRDDIVFELRDRPARHTASRGEVRTLVLALKTIELSLLEAVTETTPLLLLDDVFSELDEQRQRTIVKSSRQTIITSTHSVPIDAVSELGVIDLAHNVGKNG